jgi:hypothetical protein
MTTATMPEEAAREHARRIRDIASVCVLIEFEGDIPSAAEVAKQLERLAQEFEANVTLARTASRMPATPDALAKRAHEKWLADLRGEA